MPNDATEAALGLLGLTGAFPSSSTTTTSTIPAKRKQPPARPRSPPSTDSQSTDSISCICGFTYDDGFSIGCDSCSRWSHAACFNIVENQVPDEWQCWICDPRPVDKERAVKLQKARQRQAASSAQANGTATSNGRRRSSPGVERKTRRPSAVAAAQDSSSHPGEKPTQSNKRKRRASTSIQLANNNHTHPPEDEHVDIDEPWTHSYVPTSKDIVPADETRDRLRRVASDWRGVSAINGNGTGSSNTNTPGCTSPALLTPDDLPYASPASLCPPQISIAPLHGPAAGSVWPGLYANGSGSHSVRPPSYAVHANKPIQSSKLIAPYPSTIIPTSMYLRDPLNAYAHLGMPKPYVHLFGPPLDVALDSRVTGDQSRFVRSGCKPNAILRPMLCGSHGKKAGKDEREDEAITFGIFALRDLKPNEEVVVGWEWDDDNVIHHLPALIQSPFTFPPHQIQQFRNQMTSMLHSLASTFTTCACGAKARDCVLNRIAEFVENQTPLTPSPSPPSQFAKEKEKQSGKSRKGDPAESSPAPVDLGPLVGVERGFKTRERIPSSGGMGGVEMVPPSPSAEAGPSRLTADTPRRVSFPDDLLIPSGKAKRTKAGKGKGRAQEDEESDGDSGDVQGRCRARRALSDPEAMDVDAPPPQEECLPPRLRKAWIAKSLERLRVQRGDETSNDGGESRMDECCFDSRDMPPPPVPPSRTPPLLSTSLLPLPISATSSTSSTSSTTSSSKQRIATDGIASPSVPFSKLSLLSPVVPFPLNTPTSARPKSPIPSTPLAATSKPESKKRRRPTDSPQPPLSDLAPAKPAKVAKAKTGKGKEKAKDKERDDESEEERDKDAAVKAKSKSKSKPKSKAAKEKEKEVKEKLARPSTPATESDEPVLKASIVRRADKKPGARAKEKQREKDRDKAKEREKARSASAELSAARSTASASATASPCVLPTSLAPLSSPGPPPTTPVIVLPDLPPEPPDQKRWSVAVKAPDTVADGKEGQPPDAMDVDRPPASTPTPKASPAVSVRALPTPPVASLELPMLSTPSLPSPSPAASPAVTQVALPPSEPPTARSPSPPRVLPPLPPPPPPEPPALELGPLPQDAMVVDQPEVAAPNPPPSTVQPAADSHPHPHPDAAAPSLPLPSPLPPPEPEPRHDSEAPTDRHSSPAPHEPEREPEQGSKEPPPPAKVKLSLRDFALRKKKQREEQKEREKEVQVRVQVLDKEQDKVGVGLGSDSPRIAMTSPLLEPDVPAIATEVRSPNPVGLGIVNGDLDGDVKMADSEADAGKDLEARVTIVEDAKHPGEQEQPLEKAVNGVHDARAPDAADKMSLVEEPPPPPPPPMSPVEEPPPPPMSPVVKEATSDFVAPVPNGHSTYSSTRRSPTPDRFFYGRRKTSEPTWDDRRHRSPSPDYSRRRRSPSFERRRRSSSEEYEERRDYRRADSVQTKVELIDSFVPNGLVAPVRDLSPSPITPPRTNSPSKMSYSPPPRNSFPTPQPQPQSQPQSSQEDGEIFSPPPPKAPPLAPRSHTPPTHPRSFYAARGDISPTRRSPPPSSARRPLHPTQYARNPGPPRLAPSAPRALRESMASYPSQPLYGGGGAQNAPYFAPRGPSADRDRGDRGRDWGGRDRGDSERTWIQGPSRGRGRGTWGR